MRDDAMARLAAADPVKARPAVPSPERLRRRIENDPPPSALAGVHPRRRLAGRRIVLAAALVLVVSVAALLLGGGSSDPGVNVAAAAYAATSPRDGVVEAVFVARSFRAPAGCGGSRWCSASRRTPETLRQEEWVDAATGRRRELNTIDAPGAKPPYHQVSDAVFAPHLTEEWTQPNAVDEVRVRHFPSRDREQQIVQQIVRIQYQLHRAIEHMAFAGIAVDGVEGIELFRHLYRIGAMRLSGRVSRGSEQLWKLESREVGRTGQTARSDQLLGERTRLVVLVDPRSFLPVTETQIDLSNPARPFVVVESNLVRYRRLAAAGTSRLFNLPAQHPQAQVLIRRAPIEQLPALKRRRAHSAPPRRR
jgi:hypothetical protein